ncbi:ABC transporter ATP-binding protein [Staphylococcus capitis]|uniref:ABC transporter ATP-binding protein n=1 Tax=Staphylococcus capitis TaxID=29388 RepID=A0A7Z7YUC4_STACP|nr:ABC transporter ATP-binding protein [Staphylococcus capitis]MDS4004860.1 ABC transporter ATP-binding protein [Staphylococcus capitis]TBW75375.1 ABC transporter ATP-binding protein [Staphylococcus capitis]
MLKGYLKNTKKESLLFIFAITLNVLGSFLTLTIPLLIRNIIDEKIRFITIMIILSVGIVATLFLSLSSYMLFTFSERKIKKLRNILTDKLLHSKILFFDKNNSSRLSSRIINDTENLRDFFANNIPDFITGLMMVIGGSIMLFLLDWKLAFVILIGLFSLIIILNPFSSINSKYTKKKQSFLSILSGELTETFQQIRIIKSNQSEKITSKNISQLTNNVFKIAKKSSFIDALINPIVFAVLFTVLLVIFTYGGIRVANNTISTGTLISFFIYLIQLLTPISQVGNFFNNYAKAKGSTEEITNILKLEKESDEGKNNIKNVNNLIFNNIFFSYNSDNFSVLSKLNLSFQKGQKTSIVGPSGSGKSTIIQLIERFYTPQIGQISSNDLNIQKLNLENWREKIALITQDNSLFTGTIYDNLISGLKKIPTNNEIMNSLKKAHIYEEIMQKKEGLKFFVGEKGSNLSEGQKQRVQIARAFLKNSEIFIFDEATSNLDSKSEKVIMDNLNKNKEKIILIIIAHRLSTIQDSDYIYFIENGTVTGEGSHQHLLKTHYGYKNFISNQTIE